MDHLENALEFLAAGNARIKLADYLPDRYDEFQALAEGIMQAKALGLVYEASVERSKARETYGHALHVLTAGGLTPAGKKWLLDAKEHEAKIEEARARRAARQQTVPAVQASQSKPEEILQLKPTFMGMGIDLKALWKRFRSWRAQ